MTTRRTTHSGPGRRPLPRAAPKVARPTELLMNSCHREQRSSGA